MKMVRPLRSLLALVAVVVLVAAAVPTTFAQDKANPDGCMNSADTRPECGGGGDVPPDPEPEPGPTENCPGEPDLQPDLYINDEVICGLSPRPYLQDGRWMYGLRAVAGALERSGQGTVVLDYWVVEEGASRTQHVSVASRNRELLFTLGSKQVRVWVTDPDTGEQVEIASIWMSVPAVAIDGATRLPLRYIMEGLGGTIDGWNPYVRVTYHDNSPTPYEVRMAEAMVPGSLGAYRSGLLTRVEFLWLADYGTFWGEMGRRNSKNIPTENTVAYIRYQALQRIVETGRRPADKDYEHIARVATLGMGFWTNVTPEEARRAIASTGEQNMRTAARIIGLDESGINSSTGKMVSFKEYNDLKAKNPSWNGPDGIYVVNDQYGVIMYVIIAESKATLRPWVSPSRFETNAPLSDQLENLKQWREPTVRKAATEVDSMRRELDRLRDAGEITTEQHAERLQVYKMDFASSSKGGVSRGYAELRKTAGKSFVGMDLAGRITRLVRSWAPPKDKEPMP